MNLNLLNWNSATYLAQRYPFILAAEESGNPNPKPYNDGKGLVTIGIGFNLSIPEVRNAVLAKMGITDQQLISDLTSYLKIPHTETTTAQMQSRLNGIMGQYTPGARFEFASATPIIELFEGTNGSDGLAKLYENKLDAWALKNGLPVVPQSAERLVLLSLAYIGLLGPKLATAIKQDKRAEAWFEIRYGWKESTATVNNPNDGWAKRHYLEASMFGLYNTPGMTTADEAKDIYRMLETHRAEIIRRENTYGRRFDDTGDGTRNTIIEGRADYSAILASVGISIPTINEALTPARDALFAQLQSENPTGMAGLGAGNYLPTNIYLDPNRNNAGVLNSTYDPVTGAERTANDILIGEGGNDYLMGGKGDDVLIGGAGFDTYYYRAGDGNDRIIDSDKQGRILVFGADGKVVLDTSAFIQDPNNPTIWKNSDGQLTLTHNSPWKIVAQDGGEIQLGEDFQDGDYGIHLKTPGSPPPNQVTGTAFDDNDLDSDTAHHKLVGGGGDDRLKGLAGRDQIEGEGGADILEGGAGADILAGRDGNDRLYGDVEIDLAQAIANGRTDSATGQQGDWLAGGQGDDILIGGADNDALSGGDGFDILIGGAGDDILNDADYTATSLDWKFTPDPDNPFASYAEPVDDRTTHPLAQDAGVLYGGAGNDHLAGWGGDDTLYGESGDDVISGGHGSDIVIGGDGADKLTGEYGLAAPYTDAGGTLAGVCDDILDGGAGNDWLQGEQGDDRLDGGDGDDELLGDTADLAGNHHGDDTLDGGAGNDVLKGQGGDDDLAGGDGDDRLEGDFTPVPVDGPDVLDGQYHGQDTLDGGAGADTLIGWGGDDLLFGGDGDDQLLGDEATNASLNGQYHGDDYLDGGAGKDGLAGQGGDDLLDGGEDEDSLYGGDGNDILIGGAACDTLDGGVGNDRYEVAAGEGSLNAQGQVEAISDSGGDDTLALGAAVTAVTRSPDNPDLFIAYGAGDLIAVKDGIQGAVEHFEIGGETLSVAELVGRKGGRRLVYDFRLIETHRMLGYSSRPSPRAAATADNRARRRHGGMRTSQREKTAGPVVQVDNDNL